jgi:tetratricopeptide (TPR) repeat protein
LGSIYKIQNLKDVAILHFKKALEINPENIEIKKELKLLSEMKPKEEKGGIFGIKKK